MDSALRKWRAKRQARGARPIDLAHDFDGWLEDEPGFSSNGTRAGHGAAESDRGITRRFEPVPDDAGPEPSPTERAAGLALVREALAQASTPMPDPVTTDPEKLAQREASRADQKRKLEQLRGPGAGT